MANGNFGSKGPELTNVGQSRVERYKWKPLTAKPDLRWIDKTKIVIDHSYQREVNEPKAVQIAGNFSWPAFAAIVVAERPDGMFVCTDGQHRLLGAQRRIDIMEVPCVVFQMSDVSEEAQAFLDGNTLRKPLQAIGKFKAKLMTGDEHALLVQQLVTSTGRVVNKGGDGVRCVAMLEKCARVNAERLKKLWPLIDRICENRAINEVLVDALFYIEGKLENDSLLEKRWKDRLIQIGAENLLQGAYRAAAFYTRGGQKVWALGVTEVINKGLRKKMVLKVDLPKTVGTDLDSKVAV